MKKLTLIACLILFAAINHYPQIPNAGFENWTGNNPDGWITTNFSVLGINVTQTSTCCSGNYAAKLEVILPNQGEVYRPDLTASNINISEGYGSLKGHYQFNQLNDSDYIGITVTLSHQNTTTAGGVLKIKAPSSTYNLFEVPLIYFTTDTPDKAYISILVSSEAEQPAVGSFALIDDLTFGGTVGISETIDLAPTKFYLEQNYPNPFNPTTTIKYSIPSVGANSNSPVQLKVYDILGSEVATLVNKEQEAGYYEVNFDGSRYTSGGYIYRLVAGDYVSTKKMMMIK